MPFGFIQLNCYTCWYLLWMIFFSYPTHEEHSVQKIYSVGETLLLGVRENVSVLDTDDVRWVFNWITRIKGRSGRNLKTFKYHIFKNGTLKICDGNKSDSGHYNLIIYNESGTMKTNQTTIITFLEPVSELSVRSCVSDENITVTCSVGCGDDVRFLWTWKLNGITENETSQEASNEHTISFKNAIPDNLTCTAFNNISKEERSVDRSLFCRGHVSTFVAFGIFLSIVLGLLTRRRDVIKTQKTVADENIYLEMRGVCKDRTMPQNTGVSPENNVYVVCRSLHLNSTNSQTNTVSPPNDTQEDVYV